MKKLDKTDDKDKHTPMGKENELPKEEKSERKVPTKIRFVEHENNEQNYHTPISFKMNKFIMCFKSEPDLSRVQSNSESERILNRGRFIAKKLLSGVSMVNLRRPFANSTEKRAIAANKKSTEIVEDEKSIDEPVEAQPTPSKDEIDCEPQPMETKVRHYFHCESQNSEYRLIECFIRIICRMNELLSTKSKTMMKTSLMMKRWIENMRTKM